MENESRCCSFWPEKAKRLGIPAATLLFYMLNVEPKGLHHWHKTTIKELCYYHAGLFTPDEMQNLVNALFQANEILTCNDPFGQNGEFYFTQYIT